MICWKMIDWPLNKIINFFVHNPHSAGVRVCQTERKKYLSTLAAFFNILHQFVRSYKQNSPAQMIRKWFFTCWISQIIRLKNSLWPYTTVLLLQLLNFFFINDIEYGRFFFYFGVEGRRSNSTATEQLCTDDLSKHFGWMRIKLEIIPISTISRRELVRPFAYTVWINIYMLIEHLRFAVCFFPSLFGYCLWNERIIHSQTDTTNIRNGHTQRESKRQRERVVRWDFFVTYKAEQEEKKKQQNLPNYYAY